MQAAVLGAGELGTALSLALMRNRAAKGTTLFTSNEELASEKKFSAFKQISLPIPDNLNIQHLRRESEIVNGPLFICVPFFLSLSSPLNQSTTTSTDSPVHLYRSFVTKWIQDSTTENELKRFICVFSRGLSSEGDSVSDWVSSEVQSSGRQIPVLCGAGPFLPQEWAVAASPAPSPFSGVSLTLAFSSLGSADPTAVSRVGEDIHNLFKRENVSLLSGERDGEILSVCSACTLLCAFGAGLVSNAYAGNSVSALASYSQNAIKATEEVVNHMLSRPSGTPLPASIASVLHFACTARSSKEFVLGRRLDFDFKVDYALKAVFKGGAHTPLTNSVDGIYSLMQKYGFSSPFYEVLMDTFNTHLRASKTGIRLVKEDLPSLEEEGESELLSHIKKVDGALFSGDQGKFEEARRNMEKALGSTDFSK